MECVNKKLNDVGVAGRVMRWFISVCDILSSFDTFYAGLIVCFAPSVLCQTDLSSELTFEKIYNSTDYAQLRNLQRPYIPVSSISTNRSSHKLNYNDMSRGNEVDGSYREDRSPLLVGFSRDPFRYSVPEEDYLKGVRSIDPQDYMSKTDNRGKRGVFHLYNMLQCATGCDPLSYKGYGCYCGFLGSGRPTDGIDRCCKLHDECYENIYCPFYTVYFQPYYWKCYRGQPLCALENHHTRHQIINGCSARLCDCDRQFAMCIKRYRCPRGRALCRSSPLRLLQNILMFR